MASEHGCEKVLLGLALCLLALAKPLCAERHDGPGVSDAEITIGQTMPYSGALSVYGQIGRAQAAYFAKLNAEGGINGRKIRLISLDDGYLPPKAIEQVRRLVEQDQVLLIFNSTGTATNLAVRNYVNARQVPHLFVAGGDTAWGEYRRFPWTIGWGGSHQVEGRLYAEHVLANHPAAKVGLLTLHDDYGRDYAKGFKEGLGERSTAMIVSEQTYEYSDPTVDSQVITLKAAGADTLLIAALGRHATQAFRKIHDLDWHPTVYISVAASSPRGVLKPAGLDAARGFITAYYGKSPEIASTRTMPAMQEYFAWARRWYPEGDAEDGIVAYGYQAAQALEYVLRKCGNDLTRANVIHVATRMDHVALPMLYPGITANTSPTNYFPLTQFQMFEFTGAEWRPFGPVRGR